MEYSEQNRPDEAELTADELRASLREQLADLLHEQPELAIAAADEIGWTVVPPAERGAS